MWQSVFRSLVAGADCRERSTDSHHLTQNDFNFYTSLPSRNNALPRAQQAIQAHSICISTPRYPLILLPHLNHYTFNSVCARRASSFHPPYRCAEIARARFVAFAFANCQTVVPLEFDYVELIRSSSRQKTLATVLRALESLPEINPRVTDQFRLLQMHFANKRIQ